MGALGRGNRLAALGPSEGDRREAVSKGANVVVYAAGSHKGTFRDRRLVIRRRFRKGLFCSRWPRERRAPVIVVYSFFSASEDIPADLLSIVLLLIDRNFISITSYFDRSQAGFVWPTATANSPYVSVQSNCYTPFLSFLFSGSGW